MRPAMDFALLKAAFELGQRHESGRAMKGMARQFSREYMKTTGCTKEEAETATTTLLEGWGGWVK